MDAKVFASQKHQEMLGAFWPRKVSTRITAVLVRTAVTPNQVTILWGILSVLNSYTVYLALTGSWWVIPLIPVFYLFIFVLDCVDGEIARYKNMANPIGGKLLDGVCHRATEFALLSTYTVAAYVNSGSWLALPVGLILMTGDAMSIYVYERRLTALRLEAGYKGQVHRTSSGVFQRGARFGELTRKQQLGTLTGLVHYKSVYVAIALSWLPSTIFLAGLAALGVYKHVKWLQLARNTLKIVSNLQQKAPERPVQNERVAVATAGPVAE